MLAGMAVLLSACSRMESKIMPEHDNRKDYSPSSVHGHTFFNKRGQDAV